jgi:tetratricopeptide (TPR) repeat protein
LIDFKLAGLQPGWWHIHNVILHLLNTILLFFIGKNIFRGQWFPAFAAALVFLLHPLQTEAVAWVKCRDDLLAVFYSMLFILYWLMRDRARFKLGDTFILCVLYITACLGKVQAIIIPGLAMVLDLYVPPANPTGSDNDNAVTSGFPCILSRWPTILSLAVCGLCYLFARTAYIGQTAQTGYLAGNFTATMLTMTRAAVRYITLFFAPIHQQADYSGMSASGNTPGLVELACIVLLSTISVSIFLFRKRFPRASLGVAWIIISLLPVSNLVPTMQYMAERFLYLPMIGFALFAASGLEYVRKRYQRATVVLLTCCILTYAFLTIQRVAIWENSLTLFSQTVEDTPEEAVRPRKNKLVALIDRGMYQDAIPLAQKLCDRALAEGSGTSDLNKAIYARSLGFSMLMLNQKEEGVQWIEKAILLDSSCVQPYLDLGVAAGIEGQHDEALRLFLKAVELDPNNPTAHFNLAVGMENLHQPYAAERAYREAIRLGSKNAKAHEALAALLWNMGRYEDAADVYRDGLRLWPANEKMAYWWQRAMDEAAR